jgi:hypothetical protein
MPPEQQPLGAPYTPLACEVLHGAYVGLQLLQAAGLGGHGGIGLLDISFCSLLEPPEAHCLAPVSLCQGSMGTMTCAVCTCACMHH